MMMSASSLPAINASLNGISAVLLVSAWVMIKRRRVAPHAILMLSAFVTSAVFLACYLLYHALRVRAGIVVTRFPPSAWRPIYLAILISHSILAVLILPLIFGSLGLAYARRWRVHRRLSQWTFPLWLYVSVTGVVVYWMLYHLAPTIRSGARDVPGNAGPLSSQVGPW
ncbi:MAG TPA: DUF420 domain-containing protein [Tepidisphaeraceae bacterium]|nr:DUF420 domain-containing protein [Tepidisphaeraceae bacterium]